MRRGGHTDDQGESTATMGRRGVGAATTGTRDGARALLRGSSRRTVGVVRFEGRAFFDIVGGVVVLGAPDHSQYKNER